MMLAVSYSRFNLWLHKLMLRQKFKQIEKNKDNAGIYLSVDEEELIVTENKGQYIMKTSDLEMFVEVEDYFFVQMQKEMFLSIPKHQLTNEKYVRTEFQRFASLYNIPYKEKFDWVNDIYNKKSKL